MGNFEMLGALFLSAILGSFIGFQRQKLGKAAGMRTFALVTLGTTLFTLISKNAFEFGDPGRVAAQVLVGIGFIGAGTIIHKDETIEGLTTAACFWTSAAIGMAVGVGWYFQGIGVTFMSLALLLIQDKKFFKNS